MSSDITAILASAENGDRQAIDKLFPVVYDHLRAIAARFLAADARGHSLQPTAVVHEAYMKLVDSPVVWQDRVHFVSCAARAMRQLLVDHARVKRADKRGGGAARVSLSAIDPGDAQRGIDTIDVLALDEALRALHELSPEVALLVQLRFFAGLTNKQAAACLGVAPRTADKDWAFARAWLSQHMERSQPS